MATLFSTYKMGALCQEVLPKTAIELGALPGLDFGEKIDSEPVKQTRGQAAMKTWAIVVGVLIVLFCLSYLVQHLSTVEQTFAKVFPHNGAETP
jgi:hypothetical protein